LAETHNFYDILSFTFRAATGTGSARGHVRALEMKRDGTKINMALGGL
jgi:hypothetical protein